MRPDAGGGQVEGRRGPEAARAQQEHLRPEQLQLAHFAHLGQQDVALVAVALGRRQGLRRRPGAVVVLPLVEPADHRLHVGVAEVAHGLGGEGRAHPAGAVDDDRVPPCRAACPRPGTRGGRGAGGRRWGGRPARTRRAPGRRGTSRRPLPTGIARRPGPPRGWTPWPRSTGLGEWARSNLRVAPARSRRWPRTVKHYQRGQHSRWERPAPHPGGRLPSVELHEAIRRRAMVRSFSSRPVDRAEVDRILLAALRAPTAGNTQGTAWVVLEGPEQTADLLRRHDRRGVAHPVRGVVRRPGAGARGAPRLHLARGVRRPLRRSGQGRRRGWATARRRGPCPTGSAMRPSVS